MSNTIFTIGHSTRTIAEFAELLAESAVDLVVDVRSMPRSRINPQFNQESLPEGLRPWSISYEHIAALGGRRARPLGAAASLNLYWKVRGFRNYADYAMTTPFADGLARLRERSDQHKCAVMCAEAVWWRCHRRIIADYLLIAGQRVIHILGPARIEQARLTLGAVARADGTLIYPESGVTL